VTQYTLVINFSIYLLAPGKRTREDYSWWGGKISGFFTPTAHPQTHLNALCVFPLSHYLFSTQSSPFPPPTSTPASPATPVPFLCTPCQTPGQAAPSSLFSKAQTQGPTNQKQRATTDLGLCPDRASSSILSVTTPREGGFLASLGGLATVSP